MKSFIILSSLLALSVALSSSSQWIHFKSTHQKQYQSSNEEVTRMAIFHDNLKQIEEHNKLYEQGLVSYNKSMNVFGDLTPEEFMSFVRRNKMPPKSSKSENAEKFTFDLNVQAPGEVDWRYSNLVTGVKDQGACGSCWSFSATGSLEGQYAIRTGRLISFSEQNLVDCSGPYGNQDCNGGWMSNAFQYIRDYGIETEYDYPYEARLSTCRFDSSRSVLNVATYVDLPQGSETALEYAVATVGPISVAIDVTQNFQFYSYGYFYDYACNSYELNHGVLVVGYGGSGSQEYWLVKNSWGGSWGEQGYIKMAKNVNNNCGVATAAGYPVL